MKNILIIGFYDDNFGDMLIRISFEKLLKVVLRNLGISGQYQCRFMGLKQIHETLVADSDLIFFAGGGLFGLSYLNFIEFLEQIIHLAEKEDIPVVFSSIGINNMDATEENEERLRTLLRSSCIRAISVRENRKLFEYYLGDNRILLKEVCDPAVWTKDVYHQELERVTHKKEQIGHPLIGINVVRGGLFEANGRVWKLKDEVAYLSEICARLDELGMDYRLYTNGSMLDNNTLRYFAKCKQIPPEKVICPNSTRELVETIGLFDVVFAIRMHSSIICYSLGIPAVNMIWNDKIPLFYENIGHPQRAISLENWNAEYLVHLLKELSEDRRDHADSTYAMSLYEFLYDMMCSISGETDAAMFSYEEVCKDLWDEQVSEEENQRDVLFKLIKGEKLYLSKFISDKERGERILALEKEHNTLLAKLEKEEKKLEKKQAKLQKKQVQIEQKTKALAETKEKLKILQQQYEALQKKNKRYQAVILALLGLIFVGACGLFFLMLW